MLRVLSVWEVCGGCGCVGCFKCGLCEECVGECEVCLFLIKRQIITC